MVCYCINFLENNHKRKTRSNVIFMMISTSFYGEFEIIIDFQLTLYENLEVT